MWVCVDVQVASECMKGAMRSEKEISWKKTGRKQWCINDMRAEWNHLGEGKGSGDLLHPLVRFKLLTKNPLVCSDS